MIKQFVVLLVCLGTSAIAQKVKINGVDAVVGNEIVLKSDIDNFRASVKQGGVNNVTDCQLIDQILGQKLLVHFAKLDTLEVSEDRIDAMVEGQYQQFLSQAGGEKTLIELYKKSPEEMKEEMRSIMYDQELARTKTNELTGNLDVTPLEIKEFFKEIPSHQIPYIGEQIEIAQLIMKPLIKQKSKQEVIDKLLKIKKEIAEGSSFSTKAILHSEDPGSQNNGGLYKNIGRGQFVKEFEQVAFNLQEGEISDPVETEFGFHIITLEKRKGELLDLRHILMKVKPNFDELRDTENKLDSIRSLILTDKISWDDAVKKYSQDDETKYNQGLIFNQEEDDSRFEITKLDSEKSLAVSLLKEGDISAPTYGTFGRDDKAYKLFKVMKKIPSHQLNFNDDYNKLKRLTLNKKRQEIVAKWQKEHVSDVFVKLGESYHNCQFSTNWLFK